MRSAPHGVRATGACTAPPGSPPGVSSSARCDTDSRGSTLPTLLPWRIFNCEGTVPVVTVVVGEEAGTGAVCALAAEAPVSRLSFLKSHVLPLVLGATPLCDLQPAPDVPIPRICEQSRGHLVARLSACDEASVSLCRNGHHHKSAHSVPGAARGPDGEAAAERTECREGSPRSPQARVGL